MVKPMKYRKLSALLKEAGFVMRQGKGDHEFWFNGSVNVVITHTTEVSPKVTRDALRAIERTQSNE